jgi:hypothetical protein
VLDRTDLDATLGEPRPRGVDVVRQTSGSTTSGRVIFGRFFGSSMSLARSAARR